MGGRRLPLVCPSPRLRQALEEATELVRTTDLQTVDAASADPATIRALNTLVGELGSLPPVGSDDPAVTSAFGRAVGVGWGVGAAVLGGPLHYTGPVDGTIGECTPAVLSRASQYSAHDIVFEVAIFEWARPIREDPVAVAAIAGAAGISDADATGLLGGAIAGGLAIACAEYEFFSEPLHNEGLEEYLASDSGPHHHRFDYAHLGLMHTPGQSVVVSRCLRMGCNLMAEPPRAPEHDHEFDVDRLQFGEGDDGPLWLCSHEGCWVVSASP